MRVRVRASAGRVRWESGKRKRFRPGGNAENGDGRSRAMFPAPPGELRSRNPADAVGVSHPNPRTTAMWNSPRQTPAGGKRYSPTEISALLEPLGLLLDALRASRPPEVVTEPILQRMEAAELILAAHEVFQALLEETPVPAGGHPGYQEALIAELLDQCCGLVELELAAGPGGPDVARRSAWRSYAALCGACDDAGRRTYPLIERLELIYEDPEVHLCPLLTAEVWQAMLLGESGSVAAEFLWDYDWRTEDFLEKRPATHAWMVAESVGSDLDLVHQLPRTPTPEQLAEARRHLRRLARAHARASR